MPVIAYQAEIVHAAAQGTGKGALKAANPVNLAKGVFFTANGAYRALSFTLLQSARCQCYSELALSNPQMAQKFLDAFNADNKRVAETFSATISHMKESWDRMSGLERTEFIFEALTEAALAPKFQTLYIKGLRKTIGVAAAGAVSGARKGAAQVLKKVIAPGVLQDSNGVIEVANMETFFDHVPFGKVLKDKCQPTKEFYQGQKLYKVSEKIPGTSLKEGDKFYLDALHKNHLEVFKPSKEIKKVINLDGSVNTEKTEKAIAQGRRLK